MWFLPLSTYSNFNMFKIRHLLIPRDENAIIINNIYLKASGMRAMRWRWVDFFLCVCVWCLFVFVLGFVFFHPMGKME